MPTVAEIMLHHADRVAPSATIGESAALMFSSQISSVIIVDHDKVLGIVTERCLLYTSRCVEETDSKLFSELFEVAQMCFNRAR